VAREFETARWQPERGKSTGTIAVCLSPWQAYRRRASNIERLTAMWWSFKARGTRSAGGQLRWAYLSLSWSKGVRRPAPGVIHGEDLFTLKHYPGTSEHESPRRHESRRAGVGSPAARCTTPGMFISLLYYQNTIQIIWQRHLQGIYLWFLCSNL
jgi:hypothetical protein